MTHVDTETDMSTAFDEFFRLASEGARAHFALEGEAEEQVTQTAVRSRVDDTPSQLPLPVPSSAPSSSSSPSSSLSSSSLPIKSGVVSETETVTEDRVDAQERHTHAGANAAVPDRPQTRDTTVEGEASQVGGDAVQTSTERTENGKLTEEQEEGARRRKAEEEEEAVREKIKAEALKRKQEDQAERDRRWKGIVDRPWHPDGFTIMGDFENCLYSKKAKTMMSQLRNVTEISVPVESRLDPTNEHVGTWVRAYPEYVEYSSLPRIAVPAKLSRYWLSEDEYATFMSGQPRALFIGGSTDLAKFLVNMSSIPK